MHLKSTNALFRSPSLSLSPFVLSFFDNRPRMAATPLIASTFLTKNLETFQRLRPSTLKIASFVPSRQGPTHWSFHPLVVKAYTVVALKYTSIRPLADRVLVKINVVEEKTVGGVMLPTAAQTKPQTGKVVAIGEGRSVGKKKVQIRVEVDEAEEETAEGLLLTEATKEKPSTGEVVAIGPGPLDEDGRTSRLSVSVDRIVLYSKYAGKYFKGKDGSDYVVLRESDVMAVLTGKSKS
ncbi:hypothetical protein Ancab_027628 [Ancistrocladus abbreviatus]